MGIKFISSISLFMNLPLFHSNFLQFQIFIFQGEPRYKIYFLEGGALSNFSDFRVSILSEQSIWTNLSENIASLLSTKLVYLLLRAGCLDKFQSFLELFR